MVRFFRAPTVVVHYYRDDLQPIAHCGGELLGVEQENADALEIDNRAVRSRELGPQLCRETEAQAA